MVALYDYDIRQPDDLAFHKRDLLEILDDTCVPFIKYLYKIQKLILCGFKFI